MIYELHITVDHEQPDFDLTRWEIVCAALNAKPLDIRLDDDYAKHPRQVMFAAVHQGDDESAFEWVAMLERMVDFYGFSILRSKLEVPLDKSAPYADPVYHECHVKALLPVGDAANLVTIAHEEGWRASWNNLFPDDAGLEKWYFTLRDYVHHYKTAQRDFIDAYALLADHNFHTVRMESETVIRDTNPQLDEGWA